jgi:hypothetical protein
LAGTEAVAAGRRAIAIEPDNWRHDVRLACASWGEERLRAAGRAVQRLPGLALAHWLAATVHVARQAFDDAARELASGTAAQDSHPEGARFSMVGLHLMLGLVHLARGHEADALDQLGRELAFEPAGHVYARQACAHSLCAMGAIHLRNAATADAAAAFEQALERVPGHPMALVALAAITGDRRRAGMQRRFDERVARLEGFGAAVEAAMARAVGRCSPDTTRRPPPASRRRSRRRRRAAAPDGRCRSSRSCRFPNTPTTGPRCSLCSTVAPPEPSGFSSLFQLPRQDIRFRPR